MKIEVYSIPGCSYCVKLKRLLERENLDYIQTVVEDKKDFKSKYPTCTGFPFTIIDNEIIGGITDTAKFLLEKGLIKRRR